MRLGRGSTLLIGGARSGKSDLAVRLGEAWTGPVTLVATAEAGDADMAARIARHQLDRPADWQCLEAPLFNAGDLNQPDDHLVIVDCLTMLTTNLFLAADDSGQDAGQAADDIVDHMAAIAAAAGTRKAPTLFISNEVGLGVHPETALGRRYRDLHGRVNRCVAHRAETSLFVVAGRAIQLDDIEVAW